MTRWTAADLATANARMRDWIAQPLAIQGEEIPDRRRAKYRNIKCEWQGLPFDSQRELERFKEFELQRIAGAIRAVIRQVSFPLPGTRRRIRVDFLVIDNSGNFTFFDAKGYDTDLGRLKRQQVLEAFGITIQLI